jgi:hypothetical protein
MQKMRRSLAGAFRSTAKSRSDDGCDDRNIATGCKESVSILIVTNIIMPRFQLSSNQFSSDLYSANLKSSVGDRSKAVGESDTSCRLVTADDYFVHSIVKIAESSSRQFVIDTHRLPLESSGNEYFDDDQDINIPKYIRSELPMFVQEALDIDPPVELLSVEGEKWFPSKSKTNSDLRSLPRLLLYSRKSAFLFQISYGDEADVEFVTGQVDVCDEPLDQYLQGNMESSILRIRRAPQCSAGYATISPATCFAALLENSDTCEYTLLLHHAGGVVTSPLRLGIEESQMKEDCFTDFCFGKSTAEGFPLLTSMSILLLKGSGDVFSASPVVFDGTIVAKSAVDESLDYLQSQLNSLSDRNSSAWRRMKAASQFLMDVFYQPANHRSHFCTAKVLHPPDRSAAIWPVKLQGPLLFRSTFDPGPLAISIECFGNNPFFVGCALGKVLGKVDFACIAVTTLIPRFEFESLHDCLEIEDSLSGLASIVERVDLCPNSTDSTAMESPSVSIISDPIMTNLLHYSTPHVVYTISTNAMMNVNRQVNRQPTDPVRTSAWTCLNSHDVIRGIALPVGTVLGHNLVVGLKNKPPMTIDISSSSCLNDFDSLFQETTKLENTHLLNVADLSRKFPPLVHEVKPLIEKIKAGLARMGHFVGNETDFSNITPDILAVVVQIKKRCDDDVVVPLAELKNVVDKRRAILASMLADQVVQLQTAKENIHSLQTRMGGIGERLETVQSNAASLLQRSLNSVQTSHRLLPTITQAEYDFFQMTKRMNLKVVQLERHVKQLNEAVGAQCENLTEMSLSDSIKNMKPDEISKVSTLQAYENKMLTKIRARLDRVDQTVSKLAKESGISNQLALNDHA